MTEQRDEIPARDVVVGDVVIWCDRRMPVVAVSTPWRNYWPAGGRWTDITVLENGRDITLHYRPDESAQVIR
jgi:hypothetical protein